MARGGKRTNSGRKTKAEELGLPRLIEDEIGEAGKRTLIRAIYKKAKAGSYMHQQILMHYIFGKPQDKLDLTSGGNEMKSFILNVKPDQEGDNDD
jgi:hypothetical protein